MRAARQRILALGGLQAANSYVKINLSLFGLYPRKHAPSVPPEIGRSKEFHHVAARKPAAQHLIQRAEARGEERLRRARGRPHPRQPQPDGPLSLLFLLHGSYSE